MKKIALIIILVAATAVSSFYYSTDNTETEKTESKTISMAVFTSNNYAAKIYDAATAGLTVIVKKLNDKTGKVLWQQSFPSLALKLFPASDKAFKPVIKLPAVTTKDVLEVSYKLTYDSKGSVLQMDGSEIINAGSDSLVNINI